MSIATTTSYNKTVENEETDILSLFETEVFDANEDFIESQENFSPSNKSSENLKPEERIRRWKDFFRFLCYDPVWYLDEMSEPSAYRFAAHFKESEFLIQINTGMHRKYVDILSPYFTVKVYDLRKKIEIKQIQYVSSLEEFFGNKEEIKRFIKFIDSLPLQFDARPKCPECRTEFDLINPQKISQNPFWAHSYKEKKKTGGKITTENASQEVKKRCPIVQPLFGVTPNFPIQK